MSGTIVEAINQYGFPIIAAMGLGYFVYYICLIDILQLIESEFMCLVELPATLVQS